MKAGFVVVGCHTSRVTSNARRMTLDAGLSAIHEQCADTISTGLPSLDGLAVGFGPGELWVVHRHRVSVPVFLCQMACRVLASGRRVALLSRERPSLDLWRLAVSEWSDLPPSQIDTVDLPEDRHASYQRHVALAKTVGFEVSGSELDWTLADAEAARVVFVDGPSPDWPSSEHTFADDWRWLAPAATRQFARSHELTVVVGIYDRADSAEWQRYADTAVRIGRPIHSDHPRVGEADVSVMSHRHLTRGSFEVFWPRRAGGIRFVDPAESPVRPTYGMDYEQGLIEP